MKLKEKLFKKPIIVSLKDLKTQTEICLLQASRLAKLMVGGWALLPLFFAKTLLVMFPPLHMFPCF